ncbi:MAG TPA: hypothetical protein VD766_11530 [Solirubrobacterales bacterium]|nr:hypothetical protein [Solirubrobacterales bacterium]
MSVAPSRDRVRFQFERTERPRRPGSLEAREVRPKGPTLEERIAGTWLRLVEDGTAECPVCASALRAAIPCDGCGADLS